MTSYEPKQMDSRADLTEEHLHHFPMIRDLSDQEIEGSYSLVSLPAQVTFLEQGASCDGLALILKGSARVFKLAESGRELTLYRVGPGESCILTASSILSGTPFPAFAVSESDMSVLMFSKDAVRRFMHAHESWRNYVFKLLSARMSLVLSVVEEVAFKRLDQRLVQYLLDQNGNVVSKTHQEVAADLSSTREVVSRLLKDFERKGWLRLSRGKITIVERQALSSVT